MKNYYQQAIAERYACCVRECQCSIITSTLAPNPELTEWRILDFAGRVFPYCPTHREHYEHDAAYAAEREKRWPRLPKSNR